MPIVKASALAPIVQTTVESDLIVCIPERNTNSCIQYINSSINGLIELNESRYPGLKVFRGFYDYKMIARINPFWLTFEPPSDNFFYVMGALYMIIFVLGLTGNGLVIYMFARCKTLRTASNILVFNLAISDFMIIIKCPIAAYNNFMRGPALGDWGCRLYGFMGGFSGCASITMLTVISMDRYRAVVNPLNPLRLNNDYSYYFCLLFLAWLEAFFFSVIPLLEVGLSAYVPEGYLTTCSFDYLDRGTPARIFMFIFFVFAWCLPLISICYCYFHILRAAWFSKNIQSNRNKDKVELRLARIVLSVVCLWFLAWTPYAIVAMTGVAGMERYLTPTLAMIPGLFCKLASCLNPYLYTISNKRFLNELERLFSKRKPKSLYTITKSSFINRSFRLGIARNENNIYGFRMDLRHSNIKPKLSVDNTSSLFGAIDLSSNGFHMKSYNSRSSFSRNQISPMLSSEEGDILVLQLNDIGNFKAEPLETNF